MLVELFVILALILANGFLSGAEIAVVSLRKTRLSTLVEEKRPGARALAALRARPERFLATVQVGITVVGTAAGAFGGAAMAADLEPFVRHLPVVGPYARDVSLGTVVALISYLTLVLGELVPKSLALRASEPYALWVSPVLTVLASVTRPLVWLLTASSNVLLKPFSDRTNFTESRLSKEELKELVDEAAKTGALAEHTSELASRALQFEQLTGADIMVPRNRIVALPQNADQETIRRCLLEERRSRMPIYEGTIDNIIGYVSAKDLLALAWEARLIVLRDVLRPVRLLIESTPAPQLLEFMQRERQRLAILVDEHGATAGLVTFEDLMEELVGEVMSEHERGDRALEREPSGALVARGDVAVREVARALHVEIDPPPNITTMGGLCASLAGGVIPQRGARLADPSGLTLEVTEASPRFVRRVRIIPPGPAGRS
ncbi:MAG TPA: hemolysin family protein [Polyangia bacterium]|nr:hemolysin family protein [Polyangia bacterium]